MEKITNEELAIMINRGFEQTATKEDFRQLEGRMGNFEGRMGNFEGRMGNFEGRMEGVETELSHVNARLSTLEHNISQISKDMISRNEFEDLMGRMKYVELKLGIESGK